MERRSFLRTLALLPGLLFGGTAKSLAAISDERHEGEFRLAFGSCLLQDQPQPVWKHIAALKPNAFAFLGDNVYADTEDMKVMEAAYRKLEANPNYRDFRRRVPIFATWDDHDMGMNDAGREYPKKQEAKELMLRFFREPSDSIRWQRDGLYSSYWLGSEDFKVQLILLDLRWFRDPLYTDSNGAYRPNPDPRASLLGKKQWQWLRRQLREPADLRILGSSIQFLAQEHQWEKWANFPRERERFLRLLDELEIENLVVLSGDMHYGELSSGQSPAGKSLWEVTSSGLNRFESANGIANSLRRGLFDTGANFGLVRAKRIGSRVAVSLEVRDQSGVVRLHQRLSLLPS